MAEAVRGKDHLQEMGTVEIMKTRDKELQKHDNFNSFIGALLLFPIAPMSCDSSKPDIEDQDIIGSLIKHGKNGCPGKNGQNGENGQNGGNGSN